LKSLKIKSIKKVSEEDVYDIQNFEKDVFKNESNFIIDDVVAHNCGQHAGGCLIMDKPVWEYIPVVHTKDGVATAFVENGGNTELDELGVIKYDFLAISVLETISDAVNLINEELVKIEDDDGIVKIVPKSYLNTHK
jgi:DNA polymerase III alpha subunit